MDWFFPELSIFWPVSSSVELLAKITLAVLKTPTTAQKATQEGFPQIPTVLYGLANSNTELPILLPLPYKNSVLLHAEGKRLIVATAEQPFMVGETLPWGLTVTVTSTKGPHHGQGCLHGLRLE